MLGGSIDDSKILWKPTPEQISRSNIQDYLLWLEDNYSYFFEDYEDLWEWSVSASEEFWESIMEYYKVHYSGSYSKAKSGKEMYNTSWFDGIKLSYSEHVFRNYTDDAPAIVYKSELGELQELSWQDLVSRVASLKQFMVSKGVVKGDRVVAYLPNSIEASIAFFATNSIGAIWSSTSPDFGFDAVAERFSQIEPKVLIASDSYNYNGKTYQKDDEILKLINNIDSIDFTIVVSNNKSKWETDNSCTWHDIQEIEAEELVFERVEFSHPIWVLYSSGTTGVPKAITHGTGGILLEHLKYLGLHNNVQKGDRFFWYTTTGWMMWNYLHASMLHGSTIVLYDGSPSYPDMNTLWQLIDDAKINHFGVGASFITANMKAHTFPAQNSELTSLKSIGSTGSTLPPEAFEWIYSKVKNDVWVASISGGTDVCSAFVGGNPIKPVHKGEIQSIALGCDFGIFNEEGEDVFNEVGEMVIKKSMPSMPIFFWGDKDFEIYKKSYFEMYPNIWRHGDWAKITNTDGVVIYGRSDSTLNRGGVRIGTSEIYRALDSIPEIKDSLVLSIEQDDGGFSMPLFVSLNNEAKLNDTLVKKIKNVIKSKYSPRHIPDDFYEVTDIPYTISGKKMETPFKKIFKGEDPEKAIKVDSMRNPNLLSEYLSLYKHNFRK